MLSSRFWKPLLIVTALAGVGDLVFACTFWWIKAGVMPLRIGQSVAAGVLGTEASRAGGVPTALLGVVLHFAMMFLMVGFYYLVAKRIGVLRRAWLVCGALYGLGLFVVMNYVVVPLSAVGGSGPTEMSWWVGLSVVVHALIGMGCAWASRQSALAR